LKKKTDDEISADIEGLKPKKKSDDDDLDLGLDLGDDSGK
jgi:hypothetical protein